LAAEETSNETGSARTNNQNVGDAVHTRSKVQFGGLNNQTLRYVGFLVIQWSVILHTNQVLPGEHRHEISTLLAVEEVSLLGDVQLFLLYRRQKESLRADMMHCVSLHGPSQASLFGRVPYLQAGFHYPE